MLTIKDDELKKVSKEKVINIALNNLGNAAEFADAIAIFVAYIAQVVLILWVVFTSNVLAGIIIMCIGVLNFFAYLLFNKKLGKILLKRNEYNEKDLLVMDDSPYLLLWLQEGRRVCLCKPFHPLAWLGSGRSQSRRIESENRFGCWFYRP